MTFGKLKSHLGKNVDDPARSRPVGARALRRAALDSIPHLGLAAPLRTVGAAEKAPICFHAVADDPATAVAALHREGLDGALEAVERVTPCITTSNALSYRLPQTSHSPIALSAVSAG
jgi:hypothetical protein